MVNGGKHYFLSRLGASARACLDTIKLFEGSEELFRGLAIHDQWDWDVRFPVVRISFGSGRFDRPDRLEASFMDKLTPIERSAGIVSDSATPDGRFAALIEAIHERTGRRVVVLVDEYDKPILDAMGTPEVAKANRDFLRGIYSVIKDCDTHVKFTLLTGVSKFSKVGLFSGLNNLIDITLDPDYSAVCGYTDRDLDTVFAPELPGLDRDEIRRWYNGYSWLGDEKVYNPFDVLLLFRSRRFKAHWFETGSPSFLVNALTERRLSSLDLDRMAGDETLLSAFDVGEMATEALLFQTGYLTILDADDRNGRTRYRLGYPNQEVRESLNERLLMALLPDASRKLADEVPLRELLAANDFAGLEALFRSIFAGIPYEWHVKNAIQKYEGYRQRGLFVSPPRAWIIPRAART